MKEMQVHFHELCTDMSFPVHPSFIPIHRCVYFVLAYIIVIRTNIIHTNAPAFPSKMHRFIISDLCVELKRQNLYAQIQYNKSMQFWRKCRYICMNYVQTCRFQYIEYTYRYIDTFTSFLRISLLFGQTLYIQMHVHFLQKCIDLLYRICT